MTRPQPALHEIETRDVTIATWEWDGDGQPILLLHATGFHGRCWDRVVEALPGRHVFAVDVRGHGRSSTPPPPYEWTQLAGDVAEVVQRLDLREVIGVGHSMGGHLLTRVAAALADRFEQLVLLDPAIVAPDLLDRIAAAGGRLPPVRRRDRWESPDEMVARLRDKGGFARWDPRVLADYCRHGLRPSPKGEWLELACPPEIEGAVYAGQTNRDIYDCIRSIDVPVHILRARTNPEGLSVADFSNSPTWPGLVHAFRSATETHLAEATHFFPMEDPAFVAAEIAAHAARGLRR